MSIIVGATFVAVPSHVNATCPQYAGECATCHNCGYDLVILRTGRWVGDESDPRPEILVLCACKDLHW